MAIAISSNLGAQKQRGTEKAVVSLVLPFSMEGIERDRKV